MSNRNKQKPTAAVETEDLEVSETVEAVEAEPELDLKPESIDQKSEVVTLLNIGKNPHLIDGQIVKHGDTLTLTDEQTANEKLMAKINTAIKCNRLELVK